VGVGLLAYRLERSSEPNGSRATRIKKWGLFAFFVEVFSVFFVGFSEARVLYRK
jgi:hypothetical protein